MTNLKKEGVLRELFVYEPYDDAISKSDIPSIVEGCFKTTWHKTVFDYFYSHVNVLGEPVSLHTFLLTHSDTDGAFKKADELFTDRLFKIHKPLFFLDVDNTLTNFAHLSDEKKVFISNYREKERVILTTGKTYDSIKNVIGDCALSSSYASCLNGSVVIENSMVTTISQIGEISKEIVKQFAHAPFTTVVYYHDAIRPVSTLTQDNLKMLAKYNESYVIEKEIDYSKVIKILFFIYEGEAEKEKLVEEVVAYYPDLTCMRTAGHTFEILRKNQHKGNTVKHISAKLGRYYRATIGVGDSMNDSPLLNYVGKPFIVSTASETLKSFGYPELEKNRDIDIVNLIKQYT